MCLSSPDIPAPQVPQEVKQPDSTAMARAKRKGAAMSGGTLLTGPAGIPPASLNTGAPTLLGG